MNGILVVNKPKNYTSRDVVNIISKHLHTKKVGHTGTLDPIATGVLVLCVGKSLKLAELITNDTKEYIATVQLGIETDTLDITGTITDQNEPPNLTREILETTLKKFQGKITQEVPKYSAVKVGGKKLYEYARNNIEVKLPKREVEIFKIKLISDIENNQFTFVCKVSKGTYIRSLIRDIGRELNTFATMIELTRTEQGIFNLNSSYTIEQIAKNQYQLLDPKEILNIPKIIVDEKLEFKIRNGQVLKKFFDSNLAMILNQNNELLAIYKQKDENHVKPYKMFVE